MLPITLDDLLPLAEFAGRRAEFFLAHSRYLNKYRRVRVGPRLTLVFENRQTLWFHIQELLRVSRLGDPPRVQRELDWYNRLLPGRHTLQAALIVEASDSEWSEQLEFWQALTGDSVRLIAGDASIPSQLVTCRPEDRCAGAAHWLTFTIGGDARVFFANVRTPVFAEVQYRDYRHRSAPLGEAVRRSLLADLESSDRDQAA